MDEVIIGQLDISSVTPSNAGSARSWMFSLIPSNDSATEEKLEAGNNTITSYQILQTKNGFVFKNYFYL